jgi:cell division protein FtsB
MEKGHKALWWVMGIIGALFVYGAVGFASTLQSTIRETQLSLAARNERIAVLEANSIVISARLERMENKLDIIQRKVSQ